MVKEIYYGLILGNWKTKMVTIETGGMSYKYQATIIEGVRVDLLPSETQNSTIFTAPTTVESNINLF